VVFTCELNVEHKTRRKEPIALLSKFREGKITLEQLEIEENENNKEHYFGKLKRSHSQTIIPDVEEEIKEIKGEIKEFIRVKIDTIDNS